jgi:hypothetical protein
MDKKMLKKCLGLLGISFISVLVFSGTVRADTLTIYPAMDTNLNANSPNYNCGSFHTINVGSSNAPSDFHSILKFDFSTLPTGATITAATLSLYAYSIWVNDPVGRTYWAYELTQTGWVELEATWNSYKSGSGWATAGGDYTTGNGASTTVPANPGWINWNVLALCQHFQSAHGKIAHFLIKDSVDGSSTWFGAYIMSKDVGDITLEPKLVITYNAPLQKGDFFLLF